MYRENMGDIVHLYLPHEYFVWSVPNIFDQTHEGSTCVSPSFIFLNNTWRLALRKYSGSHSISLFLWCSRPPKDEMSVTLSTGDERYCRRGKIDSYGNFGEQSYINLHKIEKHGMLIFHCKIQRVAEMNQNLTQTVGAAEVKKDTGKKEIASPLPKKDVPRLAQNLKNLYLEKQFCDVVLKASGREFSAHKAILVARSTVFAAMFKHDMPEKKSGIVDIPDCSPEAFDIFMLYLYSEELENLCTETMYDVYNAAVKYNIEDLRSECVDYITSRLSVDNFCDIMTLALQCDEEKMKTCASSFFYENVKEIVKLNRWVEFMVENPVQANELYRKIINA